MICGEPPQKTNQSWPGNGRDLMPSESAGRKILDALAIDVNFKRIWQMG
jgi:hypothetical protein